MDLKNLLTKKSEEDIFKISEESASKEIQKILDYYDIDIEKDFDAEYKKYLNSQFQKRLKRLDLDVSARKN